MSRSMGDNHRRFLQTMMVNGIINEQQANNLHRHCCEALKEHYLQGSLEEFIDVINAQLQHLFMHIRKGMSEEDGMQYYALVNVAETTVTRMSCDYADNELELFRKTMDLIVSSENGTASSMDILNSADSLQTKKLKKSEAEHLLQRFVLDKWLTERRGDYSLSTRCMMEMEPYIRSVYQDQVKVCHICHYIAFQCQVCDNPLCGIKIHNPCVAKYFKGRTEPKCPACTEHWPQHKISAVRQTRAQKR